MISAYSKNRADKRKVVIGTCTMFYFCTKHKITSVPMDRKFQFFLKELVSYILLVLLNLTEFIGYVLQASVLVTYNKDQEL